MKIVLMTMLDNNFIPGFKCFIKSLLKHNPWFNYDMFIIDCGLSKDSKQLCNDYYKKCIFVSPKIQNYKHINLRKTDPTLRKTYYKLDMFSYVNVDRVVFMDMDTLILGDISYLFQNVVAPIGACKAYDAKGDRLRNDYNSGILVLNKPVLNIRLYNSMLHKARLGFSMPDQKIINAFFRKKIYQIPKIYNMEKRIKNSDFLKYEWINEEPYIQQEKVKIVHYVSQKPWDKAPRKKGNDGFEDLELLWKRYSEM